MRSLHRVIQRLGLVQFYNLVRVLFDYRFAHIDIIDVITISIPNLRDHIYILRLLASGEMVHSVRSQSKLSHSITKLLHTISRLISSSPPKYTPRMVSSPSPSASQDRSGSCSTTPSSPPGYPLQSYEIRRHDANSAILLDPSPTTNEARFAVRIHSDSIYLYRPAKETALFGEPVMEACIKGLIHKREAKLDDWREKKASQKGKYRLRHRHGMQ